jgi:hypothetical protein
MAAALMLLLLLGAAPLAAQTLVDPTVPPARLRAAPAAAAAAPAPLRLQLILTPSHAPASALLDGRWVRVGDRVDTASGAAHVLRIDAGTLTLARGERRETIELAPGSARAIGPAATTTASVLARGRTQ